MNLSEKILYCRKKAGLSQEALAEKLGVCPKTVDRAVRRMRDDGLIVSTARFDEHGSQLGNVYFIGAGSKQ